VTEETARTARLLHLDSAHLIVYERDQMATVVASWNLRGPPMPVGTRVPLEGDNIIGRVFRTQQPARIDDYGDASGQVAENVRAIGVRAAVGVPVLVGGRVWGVMAVGSSRPEPLPAETEMRIAAFTELVATAIANTEARRELEQVAAEQAALGRVATLVAEAVPPGDVFTAVAEEIGRILDAEAACVVRYEPGATGTVMATWGDASFWPIGSNWALEGVAARVLHTRRAARMDGYSQDSGEMTAMARRIGGRSRVGAPIILDDRLWGAALAVNFASGGALPAAAEERIANFAELITTAISNAETRTELTASRARVVAAADETRRRLERDLHDGIQQRLVSLALKARAIETMAPRPADNIQGELSRLADGLGTSLDELREISRGIHPAILSEAGLGPALKALARRSAVPVNLDLNLGSRPREPLEVAAYYVASEALTNAAKHAQASVIDIRVDGRDGALTLWIHDDGIGGADPSRGSGIIGLKDRVEALRGIISLLSPPGHGTTLHVQLPTGPSAAPTRPRRTP
jgi:signal transduction histidine kinase